MKRALTPSQASTGKSLPRARRATTSWPSSACSSRVSTTVGRVSGLGVGQRLADLQDRVGADHGEPALAQVQLAVALPGARGVQPDDEGVGLLLEDPGDLAPHLVGRHGDRGHQRGPFFWRLQWISSLTSPSLRRGGP